MTFIRAKMSDGTEVALFQDGSWKFMEDVQPKSPAKVPPSPETDGEDFRKVKWGASRENVLKTEQSEPSDGASERFLCFESSIGAYAVLVAYEFLEDQLVGGSIRLTEPRVNDNTYLDDFDWFHSSLSKKYGSPSNDDDLWKDDLYRDTPSDWGTAVATGRYTKRAIWDTPTTEIVLMLYGENFEVTLVVLYRSKAFKDAVDAQHDQDSMDGL